MTSTLWIPFKSFIRSRETGSDLTPTISSSFLTNGFLLSEENQL